MAKKPITVLSSSSEHRDWSYSERGMGGRETIAGGGLCVLRQFNNEFKKYATKN